MKKVYPLRYGKKDVDGILHLDGKSASRELGAKLPGFEKVIASCSSRTKLTARLLNNTELIIGRQIEFYMASKKRLMH